MWETLHYLFRSLLGWSNPAQGLAWWYKNGKPTADSELLKTVMQLWGWDDAIVFYAAWAWSNSDPTAGDLGEQAAFPDDSWWAVFRKRLKPTWNDLYHGGTNPLHLEHSEARPNDWIEAEYDLNQSYEIFYDVDTRRAVWVVDHIGVWRDALNRADGRLPDLGNHSWYVQIFDRQYGGLGIFRKSRMTGRWLQGKHSIHMVGNSGE